MDIFELLDVQLHFTTNQGIFMIVKIAKRVGILFIVIIMSVIGFCIGYGVVFAHIVPGWV